MEKQNIDRQRRQAKAGLALCDAVDKLVGEFDLDVVDVIQVIHAYQSSIIRKLKTVKLEKAK